MASDYRGDLKEFALVVPVPELLTRDKIQVVDRGIVDRIDSFSAPRLVEYFDSDPCKPQIRALMKGSSDSLLSTKTLSVRVEAQFTVGEYDIVILSADDSGDLEKWLRKNNYQLSPGSEKALKPYVKQGMKFFVARVNLKQQTALGYTYLRPIQISFDSPKFMLPIRLGMLNAEGPQDLIVYFLTRQGRVETTNYRVAKIPSEQEIPLWIRDEFPRFYADLFSLAHQRENGNAVFLEYSWNVSSCDPCAAEPLNPDELRRAGVFWLPTSEKSTVLVPRQIPKREVHLTRLHLRYDEKHFAEDLFFQQTADTQTFQGRYVLRHPWNQGGSCPALDNYLKGLSSRVQKDNETLARLTGWELAEIQSKKVREPKSETPGTKRWYEEIF